MMIQKKLKMIPTMNRNVLHFEDAFQQDYDYDQDQPFFSFPDDSLNTPAGMVEQKSKNIDVDVQYKLK